jgi:hypothetical protein
MVMSSVQSLPSSSTPSRRWKASLVRYTGKITASDAALMP